MIIELFKERSTLEVFGLFLAINVFIFVSSVVSCWFLGRIFGDKRIFDTWEPLRRGEQMAAFGAVILNTVVSVVGWMIWEAGYIEIRSGSMGRVFLDCTVMLMAMDLGMYVFHRVAHTPLIYQLIHGFHHRHESTNPISLFVLHPLEVVGFGGMMVIFLLVYPMTLIGLCTYLTLNIVFGTLGHSGVEPFPASLRKVPLLKYLGTSTFHAEHHEHPSYNFGFYTLIWDKLFGTLDPDYDQRFSQKRI